ncbi:kinase-like protein [Xylaria palmicola]|nr:kinase-like protein [Xylaria palmicola]
MEPLSRHSSGQSSLFSGSSTSEHSSQTSASSVHDSTAQGLYDRLRDEVVEDHTGFRFLPLAAMEEAVAAEIEAAQSEAAPADAAQSAWRQLLLKIRTTYHDLRSNRREIPLSEQTTRVFGLLGLCDKEEFIQKLLKEGLTDADLPFQKQAGRAGTLVSSRRKEFKSFSGWKRSEIDVLCGWQGVVCAPVFTKRGEDIQIDKIVSLPVYDIEKCPSHSSTGTILKARLHASHLKRRPKSDPRIAVKQYDGKEDFERERDNLKKIQGLNHRHLIRHIATVEQGEQYYAVLYWADGGNFTNFLKQNTKNRCPELLLWCFEQMSGLTDALVKLHETNYRHGDLKPENILHFIDSDDPDLPHGKYGMLVIADVGVSRIHHQATTQRRKGTETNATTQCYEAPEAEIDQDKPRSRRYDMWSVGCIFMEFAIWLLYGQEPIDAFRKRRGEDNPKAAYYKCSGGKTEIHPAVLAGLDALRADARCAKNSGLADLVSLIADDLLVINPKGSAEAEGRAEAGELKEKFGKILEKVKKDNGFLATCAEPSSIPDAFKPG